MNKYYFIFLVIIIYYIIKIKKDELSLITIENFSNNFASVPHIINQKIENNYSPSNVLIYSNYKYSLEYKLVYELVNKFNNEEYNFINQESTSLSYNFEQLLNNQDNSIYLCHEYEFYEKIDAGEKNIRYIASLYDIQLFLSVSYKINILTLDDFINYEGGKLNIGIPRDSKFENKNKLAKNFFDILGIDIYGEKKKNDKYNFIFDSEENLYFHMKLKDSRRVDIIFNSSNFKNTFLKKYLNVYDLNSLIVINNDNSLLTQKFKGRLNYKFKYNLFLYKKNRFRIKEYPSETETFSLRLCFVTNKNTDEKLIYYFTKKLFSNINFLNNKLNSYLLNYNDYMYVNFLKPRNMFYLRKKNNNNSNKISYEYHDGAKKYYEDINYIIYNLKEPKYLHSVQDELKHIDTNLFKLSNNSNFLQIKEDDIYNLEVSKLFN